jgi:hypothetical protein
MALSDIVQRLKDRQREIKAEGREPLYVRIGQGPMSVLPEDQWASKPAYSVSTHYRG